MRLTKNGIEFSLDRNPNSEEARGYGAYSIKKFGFRIFPYFPRVRGWFLRQSLIYCVVRIDVEDLETGRNFACIGWYPIITSPAWFLRRKEKYIEEAIEWILSKLELLTYAMYSIYVYPEEYEEEFSGHFKIQKITFCGAYIYETEKMTREEKLRIEEELREKGFPTIEEII
ncbi:MAG: hypothetical protein QXS37_03745 [Candidatus Aenigmatarchaeota archaeon]